ncbi:MAG: hypothetical protein P4L33_06845 [Capsulimonadaceae bacterium]|nr:hypothetical protein [Capsulimonadaceae bacterium]
MATITAPLVETHQVVTGILYQISLSEAADSTGITRVEIGPYRFRSGPNGPMYPEAPTCELTPPGFQAVRWITDAGGASYLYFEGGRLLPGDGEVVFQLTSNYPPSTDSSASLVVWRDNRPESFRVPCPDYTKSPPTRNARHDSRGLGRIYQQAGCLPQLTLAICLSAVAAALAGW